MSQSWDETAPNQDAFLEELKRERTQKDLEDALLLIAILLDPPDPERPN